MTTTPIRLGIVGCGAVTRISHLRALAALPEYEVRYLCDKNLEVARAANREFGLNAKVTTDFNDMSGEIDAAIVCAWPSHHFPITMGLLKMGVDVLCEKPITTTSSDAIELAEAATRSQRIVAVGQWCRCLKISWILRRLLSLEFVGQIQAVTAEFGDELSWPMATGAYFDRKQTGGGVMFDAGIHVLDLIVWMFGELHQITYRDDSFGGMEANGILSGVIKSGDREIPCRVAASWTHALFNGVRIVGTEGEIHLRFANRDYITVVKQVAGEPMVLRIGEEGCDMPFRSGSPQQALLEDFAFAVGSRRAPVTAVDSAILPLKILEMAYTLRRPLEQPWVTSWGNQP